MAKKQNLQLTSVKLHEELFDEFKVLCVRTKFSFQKLADRSMYLYLTDGEFRSKIHDTLDISLTGSTTSSI
jgi:hypothetical protein